ncbi:uncharacterized protein LOC123316006 [Coccinella septempunctata]|uniref:uncharacterized protein LOC123316006 n=1 Tax=Coccinella septempunctata TaxID=41139 RepID=UPI001D079385|nr:uncharacterized protein LOC123316006 [Coccinella septempunctata]
MMLKFLNFALSSVFVIVLVECKSLPKYVKKCSLKNSEEFTKCAVDAGNAALQQFVHGDKNYKIPNLDPLEISSLELNTAGLKLTVLNVIVEGIQNSTVKSVRYDATTKKFYLDVYLDRVTVRGHYKVDGKILVLPISGEGEGRLEFLDGDYHYIFDFDPVKKNGKETIEVEHPQLKTKFGGAKFELSNLFNGNEKLVVEMNHFLNENWSDVVTEFESLIVAPIRGIVFNVFRGIVNELTYAEVFDDIQKLVPRIVSYFFHSQEFTMLLKSVVLVFAIVSIVSRVESKTLPKYIQKCSLSDPDKFSKCAIEVAKKALPNLLTGDKEYKIQTLKPLKISQLQLSANGLNLTLSNQLISGIETVDIKSIKYDKNSGKFTLDMTFDYLKLVGQYSIGGKILVLPVAGNGDGVLEFKQCHLVLTFDLKPGNGGKLKVENENLETDFGGAHFHMDNLFNGDKRLGDELNKFLNENWKEVISEFQELVRSPMKAIIKSVAVGILENLTLDEAFADA